MSSAPELDPMAACCFHCGDELEAAAAIHDVVGEELRAFCCHGCLGAARLIHDLGLFNYYDRREVPNAASRPPDPRSSAAFEQFDDEAIQRSFVTQEPGGDLTATLSVSGMRCAACSWLLEERLARLPGVSEAQFGLGTRRARVRWNPSVTRPSEILGCIAELGYAAAPFEPDADEAIVRADRRAALKRLGISGLGSMQVMMFSAALYLGSGTDLDAPHRDLLRFASWLVATPVLVFAGSPFLQGAWRDIRVRTVGPDVPIALALLLAYLASAWATVNRQGETYFDSVCMFIFLLALARTFESDLRARAELRIRSLGHRVPRIAHLIEGAEQRDVPLTSIQLGDELLVRPGEIVPADGLVVEGRSEAIESLLTGEPSPVGKASGSPVLAGSENLDGTLRMRVERLGASSTVEQIATLLDRAQLGKQPIAQLANRLARVFLSSVLAAACIVALVWWQVDPSRVVPIVIAVLIATCPCALSLATPAALAAATHGLAAKGLLITRPHVLDALARVTRVVFDKTGTLTESTPALRRVEPVRAGVDAAEALRLAARLEEGSTHPIARAFRAAQGELGPAHVSPSDSAPPESEPGRGMAGRIEGRRLRLGRADWSLALSNGGRVASDDTGDPRVCLADEGGAIAWFDLDVPLRRDGEIVTQWLNQQGYATAILSGDPSGAAVSAVSERLHLSEAHADASPAAKVEKVDQWIAGGDVVLAVGDGVNDAPLLGRAQVSVAMGSGSDLARLSADAVLLDDRLTTLPLALCWARSAKRVIRQNFAWALAYNLCVLPLAATGMLPPYAAALGMSLSSLLVAGNSLRLCRAPRDRQEASPWALSTS